MTSPETFLDGRVTLHAGDCLDVLDTLESDSIDACVTDPPYHLEATVNRFGSKTAAKAKGDSRFQDTAFAGFHGMTWDGGDIAFTPSVWRKVFRVLKPGAHILAFTGSKTVGDQQSAIRAAGFEMRDAILDLIDGNSRVIDFLKSLDDAQRSAFLKCVVEDSTGLLSWVFGCGFPKGKPLGKHVDRKLLGDWCDDDELKRGPVSYTAALAETRDIALKPAFEPIILARKPLDGTVAENFIKWGTGTLDIDGCRVVSDESRWPANVIHDGSPAALRMFPTAGPDSEARFFFSAKADAFDRAGSRHPTVKPVDLIQYLVRLVTAPGQTVLDLFAGSGTAGEAAWREGRKAVLIEREPKYCEDIRRRLALCLAGPEERRRESIKAKVGEVPFEAGSLFGGLDI